MAAARRTPDREYVAPVQRLRIRYAKRGKLRFSSHRDFQRALERALRRARVPMAYSAGFSPHPRISYANSAPTGAASEAEYVEIGVAAELEPEAVRVALDEALPDGLTILDVVEVRTSDFMNRLEASRWQLELPGADEGEARAAVATLLDAEEALVSRTTKSGLRTFDVRAALREVKCTDSADGCVILEVVVAHGSPSVRPDDVLAALRSVAGLEPPNPPRVTRLAQGPLASDGLTVADPLAADRDAEDR